MKKEIVLKARELDRPEIIDELRRYAHPEIYRLLISWKTENLIYLLEIYRKRIPVFFIKSICRIR